MNFVLRYNFQYTEIKAETADHAIEKAKEFLKENRIAFGHLFRNHLISSFICLIERNRHNGYVIR